MSVPSVKPIQPLDELSAHAPKEERQQPVTELPSSAASDVDEYLRRLALSSEREGADRRLPRAVQLPPVTGLPPVEAFAGGLRMLPSLVSEHLRPPPMRQYRGNLNAPLLIIACAVAALAVAYYFSVRGSIPESESGRGPKLALLDSQIVAPPLSVRPKEAQDGTSAAPPDSEIPSQTATIPQATSRSATPSQGATAFQSEASSQGETTATLSPAAGGAQPLPDSKAVRRLDPEDIKHLLKQGEQFITAGDLATARLVFQRAAEAGDASAALAVGATYDPVILARLGVLGMSADIGKARSWYEKAKELGSPEASRRLELLANR